MTNNDGSLVALVGRNVHAMRHARAQVVSQERVAEAARAFGMTWGRSSVATLEDGRGALSAGELLLLPLVLRHALGRPVEIAELLAADDGTTVRLAPDGAVTGDVLHSIVAGKASAIDFMQIDAPLTRDAASRAHEHTASLVALRDRLWPRGRLADIEAALSDSRTEAVRKAAARLSMPPEDLAVVVRRMSGMSFISKRDELAGNETIGRVQQARRAAATRRLLADVIDFVSERGLAFDAEQTTNDILDELGSDD